MAKSCREYPVTIVVNCCIVRSIVHFELSCIYGFHVCFNMVLTVLENDTCRDGSECVIVIIVFRYVIYIVTKFIKFKKIKKLLGNIKYMSVYRASTYSYSLHKKKAGCMTVAN